MDWPQLDWRTKSVPSSGSSRSRQQIVHGMERQDWRTLGQRIAALCTSDNLIESCMFRVLLHRHLRSLLPLSFRFCKCGRPFDVSGHHRRGPGSWEAVALFWKAWVPAAVCCSFGPNEARTCSELVHPTAQARLVVLDGEFDETRFIGLVALARAKMKQSSCVAEWSKRGGSGGGQCCVALLPKLAASSLGMRPAEPCTH